MISKFEKALHKHLKQLEITDSLLIVKYEGRHPDIVRKLRTKDGRPLNLLSQHKLDMLTNKGYIENDVFDTNKLNKDLAAYYKRVEARKANKLVKKLKSSSTDIF